MIRPRHLALFLLAGVAACSGSHSLSHKDLQSQFRASISLSSESETFLRHLEGHTYSSSFIQGHLEYLQKQGSENESKLAGASAESRDAASLNALRTAAGELMQVFGDLQGHAGDGEARARAIRRVDAIQKRLQTGVPQ